MLHVLLLKVGLQSSLYFGNSLLQMHARCGDLIHARLLFDEMPQRNPFSWNTMIEAYSRRGENQTALGLFRSMPDANVYSWNVVISGWVGVGEVGIAEQLFKEMPVKDAMAFNSVIHGYISRGQCHEALRLFRSWNAEIFIDNFVFASILAAAASLGGLDYGKQVHAWILLNQVAIDSVLGSSLVNMYGKCGDMDSATRVLGLVPDSDEYSLSALIAGYSNCGKLDEARRTLGMKDNPSVVLWNSMISGYVANNRGIDALMLFNKMQEDGIRGDSLTFASVLTACSCLGMTFNGKQVHASSEKHGVTSDLIVASALVDMYFKCGAADDACKFFGELKEYDTILLNSMISIYSSCGRVEDASKIFQQMPHRSLISWNSMVVGFSQNGFAVKAIELFIGMHRSGLRMDTVTLASIIGTCARICHLKLGEQVFARATIVGLVSDQIIRTSLIDMYCKCGCVSEGLVIFSEMEKSDEVPWNCMLMGYAVNGYGAETLKLFKEMRALEVAPNDITFIAVLSACGYRGFVEEGYRWFYAMKNSYGIEPKVEHYSCFIDLLAHQGYIEETLEFIQKMPFEADVSMWSSVLRGCQTCGDESNAKKAVKRIMELDPENSTAYVQSSNIYAAYGEWESSAQVRRMMDEQRMKKNPGYSWFN